MKYRAEVTLEVVVAINCIPRFICTSNKSNGFNSQHGGVQRARKKTTGSTLRSINQRTTLRECRREVLPYGFLNPDTTNCKQGSAKHPGSQHSHSGNRIARDDTQDQTERNCLDRDSKDSLSFFDME